MSDHLSIGITTEMRRKKEVRAGGTQGDVECQRKGVKCDWRDVRKKLKKSHSKRPIETDRKTYMRLATSFVSNIAVCCESVKHLLGHLLCFCWGLSAITVLMGTSSLASRVPLIYGSSFRPMITCYIKGKCIFFPSRLSNLIFFFFFDKRNKCQPTRVDPVIFILF